MAKELAPSRKLAAKVLFGAFKVLKENGGSMRGFEVIDKIRNTIQFDEWETHRYEKTGYIRWESILHFFTIDAIKAGFMLKSKGLWTLTPEGEDAMKLGPEGMLQAANKAFRDWKDKQKPDEEDIDIASSEEVGKENALVQKQQALISQLEGQANKGISDFIIAKLPYDFQHMVAGLLEAMGYYIAHDSPKGPDGGIDVIAYTDPLGTKPPRIIVQVKHKPVSSISADEIQKLVGTMKRESDVGIFVTSGDFSKPAKTEARISGKHIELIDYTRFKELWIEYYDKMKDETKNMLPLRPIYFLGISD